MVGMLKVAWSLCRKKIAERDLHLRDWGRGYMLQVSLTLGPSVYTVASWASGSLHISRGQ